MSNPLSQASAKASVFSKWFACLGLWIMTVVIGWQVFARYVLNDSPSWAEQGSLFLMIWYVFFAAAAGVREQFHIRIAIFAEKLPKSLRLVVVLFSMLIVLSFGLAMAVWGAGLAQATWTHVIPTLGISRGFSYLPISLSGVLIVFFSIEQMVAELRGTEVKKVWN